MALPIESSRLSYEEIIKSLDQNNDGKISSNEIKAFAQHKATVDGSILPELKQAVVMDLFITLGTDTNQIQLTQICHQLSFPSF